MPAAPSSQTGPAIGQLLTAAQAVGSDRARLRTVPAAVPDPRARRGVRHRLAVILGLAVCAVLAGTRSFTAIAELAEPENRLVVRQLEAGWEAALAEAARLEADYQRFAKQQPQTLTAAQRAAIQALAADLPRVWDARRPRMLTARSCCASSSRTSLSPSPGAAS
jgi:hypothetical protein